MLSFNLRNRIEKILGEPVNSTQRVQDGYTPAIRLLCQTDRASFFVKVGATPLTSQYLQREAQVYQRVLGEFMPNMIGWEDHESAPMLIMEDLSSYHWPPPWKEWQVDFVLAQVDVLYNTRADLESYA
jgi:hypothetical protein